MNNKQKARDLRSAAKKIAEVGWEPYNSLGPEGQCCYIMAIPALRCGEVSEALENALGCEDTSGDPYYNNKTITLQRGPKSLLRSMADVRETVVSIIVCGSCAQSSAAYCDSREFTAIKRNVARYVIAIK